MKGLIYKDLLTMNSYKKSFIVVLLVFAVLATTNKAYGNFISFYIPFFVVMLSISTFNYDEYSKWDAYALTLPVTRKEIVKGKYAFALGMIIIASLVGLIINLILVYVQTKTFAIQDSMLSLASVDIGMILLLSIMFPLIYKFGAEKGRLFLFLFIAAGATLIGGVTLLAKDLLSNISWINNLVTIFNQYGIYITIVLILGIFYLSYRMSYKIYLKKEF
jgi:ABC-type transport system involved in multi-copper enzyme maturation permease subunit